MKWWLKLIIALILVVVIAFMGISAFLGDSMTKVERKPIVENPSELGLKYEDITFPSRHDEITLHGWYLPTHNNKRIIVMVHGGEMHRADPSINMLGIASELIGNGYNVLMFDLRGHGESDGERMSAGYYERRDLLGAVDCAKTHGFNRIGVLGFSMGAATTIMAAAENSDIACLVSDSSFADMKGMIEREFSQRSGFPKFFLTPVLFMVKIMYGVDFKTVKPVESVSKISPRPILFIHGEKDTFVPLDHAYRLQQASQNLQNELWIAPNATHVRAYVENKEEYINKITTFFDKVLK